jgi:Mn-dependent DtxR family transcriptional regulator
MNDEEVRLRREARRRFLEALYDTSERGESEYQDGYEIAAELGVSRQDVERIVRYHEDHGYVRKSGNHGLTVRITAQGIDHVETGGG